MGNNLDYFRCLLTLKAKKVDIDHELKILNLKYSNGVGNGSWGMIDYLCKKHGFTIAGLPNGRSIDQSSVFTKILGGKKAYTTIAQNRH